MSKHNASKGYMDSDKIDGELAPAISSVVAEAEEIIRRIMGQGSDKSAFGQWFHTDSRRYNADRLISHVTQAMMQLDGNRLNPDSSGEDAIAHLERALVRAVFLICKCKKGKTI